MNNDIAKALGFEPNRTDRMFDRAEALQNTAKAIKGLKALDDDALEHLYSEAKAERRRRTKSANAVAAEDIREASLTPLGGKKVIDYPHIEIGFKNIPSVLEASDGELSPWDAARYAGWYWTEYGYNGYVADGADCLASKQQAEKDVREFLAEGNLNLPIIYV